MNERVFIHVGVHKTASTFIKKPELHEFKNVFYVSRPYTQENYAFNLLQYADNSIYKDQILSEEFSLISKASNGKPILISDEMFFGFPLYNFLNRGQIASRLSTVLKSNAELIIIIRNQQELMLSLYKQYLKIGWIDSSIENFIHKPGCGFSLNDWIDGYWKFEIKKRYLNLKSAFSPIHFNYLKILDMYNEYFDNVHVLLYEDFKNNPYEVVNGLCEIISCNPDSERDTLSKIDFSVIENPSISSGEIEKHRIINSSGNDREKSELFIQEATQNIDFYNHYIKELINDSSLLEDNFRANEKYLLGMERYSELYFK